LTFLRLQSIRGVTHKQSAELAPKGQVGPDKSCRISHGKGPLMFRNQGTVTSLKQTALSVVSALISLTAVAAPVSIIGNGFTVTYDPALIDPLLNLPRGRVSYG
jgi:hypothetical protein